VLNEHLTLDQASEEAPKCGVSSTRAFYAENFLERRLGEVQLLVTRLPRRWVNSDKKEGRPPDVGTHRLPSAVRTEAVYAVRTLEYAYAPFLVADPFGTAFTGAGAGARGAAETATAALADAATALSVGGAAASLYASGDAGTPKGVEDLPLGAAVGDAAPLAQHLTGRTSGARAAGAVAATYAGFGQEFGLDAGPARFGE